MSTDTHIDLTKPIPQCRTCDAPYPDARKALGYATCLSCGEAESRQHKHTVAPMHKSNYMLITSRADLIGINNKGGIVHESL